MLRKTSFSVNLLSSCLSFSISAPFLPITMPGRAVWMLTFALFAARSISILRDAGVVEALLQELADLDVLVEPLGVVALARTSCESQVSMTPRRKPDRMNFLSHRSRLLALRRSSTTT